MLLVCAVPTFAADDEEGKLPETERVSYQTAFPQPDGLRIPSFMDVFASLSQQDYINVGLKWKVTESKAGMAYAVRLSAGHKPIALKTDDYHMEAFSKGDNNKKQPKDFTKLRFRQKGTYSGALAYAQPDSKKAGLFVLWDNKKKAYARLQVSELIVESQTNTGAHTIKKKLTVDDMISSKKNSVFAGTIVGASTLGSSIEAPGGKGISLYTKPAKGKIDPAKPRIFVSDKGPVGVGTTKPMAQVHVEGNPKGLALRIGSGGISVSAKSVVQVDSEVKGKPLKGQRFTILANGNVGVGEPKPNERLHVTGGVKIDSRGAMPPSKATLFVSNTLTKCDQHSVRVRDHFYVSACGRVGVKTPKPMAEFHVTGTTKTTSLDVDKNANVKGVLTINELTPMKGLLAAKTLRIDSSAQIKGKTQIDADLVVKGNLFVEKEVKMIGGGGSEESEMMMSRIALIEESHSTLMEHNKMLHSRVQELEKQLASR